MIKELIIATRNKGKLREIRELFKDLDLKITSLADYPNLPKIYEEGKSFRDNAIIKAATIAQFTKKLTLGEDSGLEVKHLKNQPGVYSARFAGDGATDKKNNAKLLRLLHGVPLKKRGARYRCFAALANAEKLIDVVSGTCEGLIALRSKGKNGFGYDPLFYLPRYQKTFGELPPRIKSKISHRAKALKKLKKFIREYLCSS